MKLPKLKAGVSRLLQLAGWMNNTAETAPKA